LSEQADMTAPHGPQGRLVHPMFPEGLSMKCKHAFILHSMRTQKKAMALMTWAIRECGVKGEEDKGCKEALEKAEHFGEDVKAECKSSGTLCSVTSVDKQGEAEEDECIPAECHGEIHKIEEEMEEQAARAEEQVPECQNFKCALEIKCSGSKEVDVSVDDVMKEAEAEEKEWGEDKDAEKKEEEQEEKWEKELQKKEGEETSE